MIYECLRCGEWEVNKTLIKRHIKQEHGEDYDSNMPNSQFTKLKGKAESVKGM